MKKGIIILLGLFFVLNLTSCTATVRPTQSKVVYVKHAPRQHKVVYVNGRKYYKWNGKHHRKTKRGYIVVRIH